MRWLLIVACLGCGSTSTVSPTVHDTIIACVVETSCSLQVAATSIDTCVAAFSDGNGTVDADQVHCLAIAGGNCTQALACVGQTVTPSSGCTDGSSCIGGKLAQCTSGTQLVTDCTMALGATPDTTCIPTSTGAGCGVATCTALQACQGTILAKCNVSGAQLDFDCAVRDETCVFLPEGGEAQCAGTGASCNGGGIAGNTLNECVSLYVREVDCGVAVPGSTAYVEDVYAPYCRLGTECVAGASPAKCNGNTLAVCEFGLTDDVDCVALGFTGCDSSQATDRCKT